MNKQNRTVWAKTMSQQAMQAAMISRTTAAVPQHQHVQRSKKHQLDSNDQQRQLLVYCSHATRPTFTEQYAFVPPKPVDYQRLVARGCVCASQSMILIPYYGQHHASNKLLASDKSRLRDGSLAICYIPPGV